MAFQKTTQAENTLIIGAIGGIWFVQTNQTLFKRFPANQKKTLFHHPFFLFSKSMFHQIGQGVFLAMLALKDLE